MENNLTLAKNLRGCSLCGYCKSSRVIAWPSDDISSDELPKGATKNMKEKAWYMVRCDYFKFTVSNPEQLSVCEAYSAKE
ncbi:hypothetical protein [Pleionea litopenaei]|uniref:Uncharacterized protein n=1 Tax=Pleionea litopenaei TaxID=3070815 RepID=A0AA51RXB2_9GAMM|nr:hypothetical protein [Pleionea sp. HL-JVS1]WMS89292.1 hypothetical protein Q9312_19345 [Pleionea sp. HL-JVS1]WMS89313.1 hypothetical protein Q9312_19235 [Pleionea sp. HL-JVS1]